MNKEIINLITQRLEYGKKEYSDELDINDLEYLHQAEELKKVLSARDSHGVIIDGPNGPSKKIEVSREKFEELISEFIDATSMKVKSCLAKKNISPNQ